MTKIVAHRGFSKLAKQNTVHAFEQAARCGAFAIETDVRVTKDGVFVAFHDKNAARLAGRHKIIEDTPFADVQKLTIYDRHRRHRIPAFTEYLQQCRAADIGAFVDIKGTFTTSQLRELVRLVDAEGWLPRTAFMAMDLAALVRLREEVPEQQLLYSTLVFSRDDLPRLRGLGLDVAIFHRALTRDRVRAYQDEGIAVDCWTVDSARRARRLQEWGADYITTNKALRPAVSGERSG